MIVCINKFVSPEQSATDCLL